jgi:putative CocE/NonD family hydrolase
MITENLRMRALALWGLLGLFVLRVLGQLLVALGQAPFLPPMEEWCSGALSYPVLLCSQLLIMLIYGKVCLDFTRGRGFFVIPRRRLGSSLLTFGALYLAVMVIRYVIRMSLYPPERWTGGSIPIFFHWTLASFLLVVGQYHWVRARRSATVIARSQAQRWFRWVGLIGGTAVLGLGVLAWIGYQLAPSMLARHLGFRWPEYAVRTERGARMMTSDGVALVSDVYHPQRLTKTPTILIRIPLLNDVTVRVSAEVVCRLWAERGYTVILQATRGRHPSGGTYVPFRDERQDGIETLRWLAQQPWWNGRLGMWGGSYFGYTQWVLADQHNPGPSALFVQICSTDWHSMFYPGGAFSLASALYWAVWSGNNLPEPPPPEFLQAGFDGVPLIEADNRLGRDFNFFNEWVTHAARDSYWAAVDGERRPESLVAPVLIMGGWYDPFLPGAIADFLRIRHGANLAVAAESRLIIGPWAHARPVTLPRGPKSRNYRLDSIEPSLPWFDRHLRLGGTVAQHEAPIRIFVTGINRWREEHEWPLARTRYVPYYLQSGGMANSVRGDGTIAPTPPALEAVDTYVYDPREPVLSAGGAMFGPSGGIALQNTLEERSDILVYSTPVLEHDLEVTGPVQLILYVSTTAPHTDFTGKLVDVHPDGSAYNVCEGILRQSYQGREQPAEIRIDLWPTSIVFLNGHRVRLEVSSSSYPRFDRNPNTGGEIATERRLAPATQTIHYGPTTPSRVVLPIIPPGAGS